MIEVLKKGVVLEQKCWEWTSNRSQEELEACLGREKQEGLRGQQSKPENITNPLPSAKQAMNMIWDFPVFYLIHLF
jgi:hypothetical protein